MRLKFAGFLRIVYIILMMSPVFTNPTRKTKLDKLVVFAKKLNEKIKLGRSPKLVISYNRTRCLLEPTKSGKVQHQSHLNA
jgi:hypothetical protein